MPDPMSDKHYEEKYTYPLWALIRNRAEEKDLSYRAAAKEVIPEYVKTIRYGDLQFEKQVIAKHEAETKLAAERWEKIMKKDNAK
jgi:hypothetical protein